MSATTAAGAMSGTRDRHHGLSALPVPIALVLLYGPVYLELAGGLWQTDAQAHAPLVGIIAFVLLLRSLVRSGNLPGRSWSALAFLGLVPGLLLAHVGLTQNLHLLTFTSQPLVLGGCIAWLYGRTGLRAAWFPLLFLLFMVPLPGFFIDSITSELKAWISLTAEELLYTAGYPIARSGVMLTIGQYQLLVADACSGLHSMISLSALGTLYIWLVQPRHPAHTLVLLASVLPIAFAANLARVLALVLLTYHQGDGVARAFHDVLGVSVFIVALLLLIGLDMALATLNRERRA
jgi:exosortase B